MKNKATKIEIYRAEGRVDECFGVEVTATDARRSCFRGRGKPDLLVNDRVTVHAHFGTSTDVWSRADAVLASWSHTAPEAGGYNKCDFLVTFEDGETYEGRYDLKHMAAPGSEGYPSLERHVRSFLECISGRVKPLHMTDEDYDRVVARYRADGTCATAGEFLDNYEIGAES